MSNTQSPASALPTGVRGHGVEPTQVELLSVADQFERATAVLMVRATEPKTQPYVLALSECQIIVRALSSHFELLAALRNVHRLISEAAMTGFNCHDGDWADRLFASQQDTHAALAGITRDGGGE